MGASSEAQRLRRLLDVGRALTADLDREAVLERVLLTAREITGARYAAIGVLNDTKDGLSQFLASGLSEELSSQIGQPPQGRGLLGMLIEHPSALRLADVSTHPKSYGFPAGHPPMRTFLGVPVMIRGQAWGNLYLTEKADGLFTEADEQAALILADWTAIAIENARLFARSETRRQDLEKAMRGLQATQEVMNALGEQIGLGHALELIAGRGRALVEARSLVIMLSEGDQLVVHARAGGAEDVGDVRLPIAESTCGRALAGGRPERIADVRDREGFDPSLLGVRGARTALLVPMLFSGRSVGILAAFDHGADAESFSADDEQILRSFATSAATAVTLAQSVQSDRLRSSLSAADSERRRWARELHDETLQSLGGLRLLLSSAMRSGEPDQAQAAMREAIAQIEQEIANLRSIITELRSAALDELGLGAAIEALAERHQRQSGIALELELGLDGCAGDPSVEGSTASPQLTTDLQNTAYRLVQEALTNVAKHAQAQRVRISIQLEAGELTVEVQDDGGGFDPRATGGGYGLAGMRERVSLAGGELEVRSGPAGTMLKATLPAHRLTRRAVSSGTQ